MKYWFQFPCIRSKSSPKCSKLLNVYPPYHCKDMCLISPNTSIKSIPSLWITILYIIWHSVTSMPILLGTLCLDCSCDNSAKIIATLWTILCICLLVVLHFSMILMTLPRYQSSWGQHGAHLGPVGPRWAPYWPVEPCHLSVSWLNHVVSSF